MAWKQVFNPRNNDAHFTVKQFKNWLDDLEYQGMDASKVDYHFDLLGVLHSFKPTSKGLSCKDTLDNYVYFRDADKYKFYQVCIMYDAA